MDWQNWQHALDLLAPIMGSVNRKRRDTDEGDRRMAWWQQALLSIGLVLVTAVGAGYTGANIAIAVHTEKLEQLERRISRHETRFDNHVESLQRWSLKER